MARLSVEKGFAMSIGLTPRSDGIYQTENGEVVTDTDLRRQPGYNAHMHAHTGLRTQMAVDHAGEDLLDREAVGV